MKKQVVILLFLAAVILSGLLIFIRLPKQPPPVIPPQPPQPVRGVIAIVIDDWGYHMNTLPIVERIKLPMTMSVLPNLSYSARVAKELHDHGFEVILHLPMEAASGYRSENNTILTSMPQPLILKILENDLAGIPYLAGVSNHMGSKATQDARTMNIVLTYLKARGLYFLDSLVIARSVCSDVAGKVKIPFAKRDVFLDNKEEPGYIRGQLHKLKSKAEAFGYAIGIGHDRPVTLEVLSEVMPELQKEGYKFVFVSEIVR
jgi:hypothetical protein